MIRSPNALTTVIPNSPKTREGPYDAVTSAVVNGRGNPLDDTGAIGQRKVPLPLAAASG
jgi:hypothetical protein